MQVAVLLCQRFQVQVILFVACIISLLEFHFSLPDQLDAWECAVYQSTMVSVSIKLLSPLCQLSSSWDFGLAEVHWCLSQKWTSNFWKVPKRSNRPHIDVLTCSTTVFLANIVLKFFVSNLFYLCFSAFWILCSLLWSKYVSQLHIKFTVMWLYKPS